MKYFSFIVLSLLSWQCLASDKMDMDVDNINSKTLSIGYPCPYIDEINQIMRQVPGFSKYSENIENLYRSCLMLDLMPGHSKGTIELSNGDIWNYTFKSSKIALNKRVYEEFIDQLWKCVNSSVTTNPNGTQFSVVNYLAVHPTQEAIFNINFTKLNAKPKLNAKL